MATQALINEKIELVLKSIDTIVANLTYTPSTGRYCYYNLEDGNVGVASVGSSHTKNHMSFGGCKTEDDVKKVIEEHINFRAESGEDISYIK